MASFAEALKQYGFVGQLANSVPELRSILQRATTGPGAPWSADEFSRAVQDSRWWRNNADSVKQTQLLRVTKPGEYKQQNDQIQNKIRTIAAEMGVRTFGGDFLHLANTAQALGWDEATLRQHIGSYLGTTSIQKGFTYGGQAGEVQQQIRQMYYDMGIPYSGYTINLAVRDVLTGKTTVQMMQANVQHAAEGRYPALLEQIRAGQTVRQIADPYIQTKAQLLEVPPESISLQDATVKKALQGRDPQGKPTLQPLWQYEQQVKDDPRWDKTKNAHEAYAGMAAQIGRDFGFIA